jgi:hypothetical protein
VTKPPKSEFSHRLSIILLTKPPEAKKPGKNTPFQANQNPVAASLRNSSPLAIDIKTEFALRILGTKVHLADRRVDALCHEDKMVN